MAECDCDYELHLGVTRKIDHFGNRWVIILLDPDSGKCNWYQSRPKPDGDTRSVAKNIDFKMKCFSDRVRIGSIQDKNFQLFTKIFSETELGRNHTFAARFLNNLAKEGLVEQLIVNEVLSAATHPAYRWKYLDIKSEQADHESLANRDESCIIETASKFSLMGRR